MIALYLLAAHLVGDFVLQTRWQAAGKLADGRLGGLRFRHVTAYCVPFVPIAIYFAPDAWRSAGFIIGLWGFHAITDGRRFHSTVGDRIAWWLARPTRRELAWRERIAADRGADPTDPWLNLHVAPAQTRRWSKPPPNPWTPIPILIDQTLHVCQLALLGGLFLT